MSVSLFPAQAPSVQANSTQGSSRGADTTNTSPTADTAQPSVSAQANNPAPSTIVTLSPDAQALSTLASKGITMTQSSLNGISLPEHFTRDDLAQFAKAVAKVAITPPTEGRKTVGVVSGKDFDAVALQFNATKEQADRLFKGLDSDSDGSISNDELLDALAATGNGSGDDLTQSLLAMMNTNGGGNVDNSEFVTFETAFVAAEKAKT